MLKREQTYRMAGRKHRAHGPGCEPEVLLKRRKIRFAAQPAGQAEAALPRMQTVPGLRVALAARRDSIWVEYSLQEHSLQEIEGALLSLGFILDNTLRTRLLKAFFHYCEETQIRNLHSPERLIKQSHQVYVRAWGQHLHGDHDDTPPELRDFR